MVREDSIDLDDTGQFLSFLAYVYADGELEVYDNF